MSPEAGSDDGTHTSGDAFDVTIPIDNGDAVRRTCGDGAVRRMNTEGEGAALGLKAIFVDAGGLLLSCVAAAGALPRNLRVREEKDCEVRLKIVADGALKSEDAGGAEAAAATLVGLAGIGISIAEEDAAGVEGGHNHLCDRLGAVSKHEGEFGEGCDAGGGSVCTGGQEDRPESFAKGGATGLTEQHRVDAAPAEPVGKETKLGSFTGAVGSLKGEKEATMGGGLHQRRRPVWKMA